MSEGVWVVYLWDMNPMIQSIWNDELLARRAAYMYMGVAFIPFGVNVQEEIIKTNVNVKKG